MINTFYMYAISTLSFIIHICNSFIALLNPEDIIPENFYFIPT